jgi:hypothetical protein
MLHPQQFEVNEAWIAFRINSLPIRTELDGDFNCIALMDAASCFILSWEFIPATAKEPSRLECRRLLRSGEKHKRQLPKTLFVAREAVADEMTREAVEQDIEVVRVPESELLVFIEEAREGFAERFESGG